MSPAFFIVPVSVVSALLAIGAGLLGKGRAFVVFKPLATLSVLAVALLSLSDPAADRTYTVGVAVGLLFSLGGDIALLYEERRTPFVLGLALFLTAHLAYATVFALLGGASAWDGLSIGLLLAAGGGVYALIRPRLGRMRAPVILYMLVVSAMVNRAVGVLVGGRVSVGAALMIGTGASLFYLSDLLLALNRFWRPWRYRRLGLAPYYAGQLLFAIAASCLVS